MCPVHTPDGAPCGLLNHLAADCIVDPGNWDVKAHFQPLVALLESRGLVPASRPATRATGFTVILDGRVAGQVADHLANSLVAQLRSLKRSGGHPHVSPHLEVCFVPRGGIVYPGIWIFTGQGRPLRPVRSLLDGKVEWIGSGEQPYLDIAVDAASANEASMYVELSPSSMLSVVARLTPFCDFNQRSVLFCLLFCSVPDIIASLFSPRNIYQVCSVLLLFLLFSPFPQVSNGEADNGSAGDSVSVPLR